MARPPGRLTVTISLPGRTVTTTRLGTGSEGPSPTTPLARVAPWTRSPSGSPSWSSPSRSPSPRSTARCRRRSRRRSHAAICNGCEARSRASRDRTGHCYMDLVDPDAARGRDTPVLKVNCWGRTWGPLEADARPPGDRPRARRRGVAAGPGRVLPPQGPGQLHRHRRRRHRAARPAGGPPSRAAPHARDRRTPPPQPGAWPCPTCRCASASWPARDPRDTTTSSASSRRRTSPSPWCCSAPTSKGRGRRRRSPGRCAPWPGSDCDVAVLVRGGGSRGDLAAFDAEPVARAIAALPMPLWTGHRPHRRPVGGRHRRQPRLRDADGVRPGAGAPGGRVVGVGGTRSVGTVGAGRAATRSRRRRGATPRPASGWAPPPATSCPGTPNGSSAGWPRSPVNARRQLDVAGDSVERRAAARRPSARSAVLDRQQDEPDTWRRLLAAYDIERQLERGYTITLGPDGAVVRSACRARRPGPRWSRGSPTDGRARPSTAPESGSTTEGQP